VPSSKTTLTGSSLSQSGKDLRQTVDENALTFDLTDTITPSLRAHLADPVDAHDATAISQSASRYVAVNVQTALTESSDSVATLVLPGVLGGCEYSTSGTDVTLDSGSTVFLNGVDTDVSAQEVTVTDSSTRYLYIDASTGELAQSASAPSLDSGHVLLYRVITGVGSITSVEDLRQYVARGNLRLPVTVATLDADTASEVARASFGSVESALAFLSIYSSDDVRNRLTIRGSVTLSETLVVPSDGFEICGEGAGACLCTSANSMTLIDLEGHSKVSLTSIRLVANHSSCIALTDSVGGSDGLSLQRVFVETGSASWLRGVYFPTDVTSFVQIYKSVFMSNLAGTSIEITRPLQVYIKDCQFLDQGTAASAIIVGSSAVTPSASQGIVSIDDTVCTGYVSPVKSYSYHVTLTDCLFDGDGKASTVIYTELSDHLTVLNCKISDADLAIDCEGATSHHLISHCHITDVVEGIESDAEYTKIYQSYVSVNSTNGVQGVVLSGDHCHVSGVDVVCPRTSWSGETPMGINLSGDSCKVESCTLSGWSTGSAGYGIYLSGTPSETQLNQNVILSSYIGYGASSSDKGAIQIEGGSIRNCGYRGVSLESVSALLVTGVTLDSPGSDRGVLLADVETLTFVGNTLRGSSTSTGLEISGQDASGDRSLGVVVSDNYFYGFGTHAIYAFNTVSRVTLSNNHIDNYLGSSTDVTARGILMKNFSTEVMSDVSILGNRVLNCTHGITVQGSTDVAVDLVKIEGNTVEYCADTHTSAETLAGQGSYGIGVDESLNVTIQNNTVANMGLLLNEDLTTFSPSGDVSAIGILTRNVTDVLVHGNHVSNASASGSGTAEAVFALYHNSGSSFGSLTVSDNFLSAADSIWLLAESGTDDPDSFDLTGVALVSNTLTGTVNVEMSSGTPYTLTLDQLDISRNIAQVSSNFSTVTVGDFCEASSLRFLSNRVTHTGSAGSVLTLTHESGSTDTTQAVITGNVVSGDSSDPAFDIDEEFNSFSQCTISGNVIEGYASGVILDLGDSSSHLVLDRNDILGVSSYGIRLLLGNSLSGLSVCSNTVSGDVSTQPSVLVSIEQSNGSYALSEVSISQNRLMTADTRLLYLEAESVQHMDITSNVLQGVASSDNGIEITVSPITGTALEGVRVSQNVIDNTGWSAVVMNVTSGTTDNVSVCGNTITSCGVSSGVSEAISFNVSSTGGEVTRLDISGNHLLDCGDSTSDPLISFSANTSTYTDVASLTFQSNQMSGCTGIGIQYKNVDSRNLSQLRILDNVIQGHTGKGINVEGVVGSSGTWAIDTIEVSRNSCRSLSDSALTLSLSGADSLQSLSALSNIVDIVTGDGVDISLPIDSQDVSFCQNRVSSATARGAYIGSVSTTENMEIGSCVLHSNVFTSNGEHGLELEHSPASDSDSFGALSVSHNVFSSNGASDTDYGFYLTLRGATEMFTLTSNQFISNAGEGFRVYTGVSAEEDAGQGNTPTVSSLTTEGTVDASVISLNIARLNSTSLSSDKRSVTAAGTNWPAAASVMTGNLDGTVLFKWTGIDDAGWQTANNDTIL